VGSEPSSRQVYFGADGGWTETPVYRRGALPAGFEATGPLIIEEYGATTVIGPGDSCRIGDLGEIRITVGD
jgi:N-methylhydantoinase A